MSQVERAQWITDGPLGSQNHLPCILEYAASHYGRHTEWFQRHRDTGIKSQVLILTAEFAVLGLHFSGTRAFPAAIICLSLVMMAVFSIVLALASSRSCRHSFRASLEHALLVTKCAWAMGCADPVAVENMPRSRAPVPEDEMLYVKRYHEDACHQGVPTTEDFVRIRLDAPGTTYKMAVLTIIVFCIGAVSTSIFGLLAVCL